MVYYNFAGFSLPGSKNLEETYIHLPDLSLHDFAEFQRRETAAGYSLVP